MKLITHYQTAGSNAQPRIANWRENYINDALFYSYRATDYNLKTYPSRLHYHDYYELVIIEEGDITYICEGEAVSPKSGDIILIPPRKIHMSRIDAEETLYKRHVFYFYPEALDFALCGALMAFVRQKNSGYSLFTLGASRKHGMLALLHRLDRALGAGADEKERALSMGLVIEIFYELNQAGKANHETGKKLPDAVAEIQKYIDEHYAEIESVSQAAAHFYYSREYVSRLFSRCFNTTVSGYINQRRIAQSQLLIENGIPLSEVCYRTGFGSMCAFIRAFKSVSGMTPSAYRALIRGK